MSPAESSSTNTLGLATSPYLRQHADNPDEAIESAAEGKVNAGAETAQVAGQVEVRR